MGFMENWKQESTYSTASGQSYHYVVLQVTLKEKMFGTGSGNLTELESVINKQAAKGYRLHTIDTANGVVKVLAVETVFKRQWCLKNLSENEHKSHTQRGLKRVSPSRR